MPCHFWPLSMVKNKRPKSFLVQFGNKAELRMFSSMKLAHLSRSCLVILIPCFLRVEKSQSWSVTGIKRPSRLIRATIWLISITHNTSTAAGLTRARPSSGAPSGLRRTTAPPSSGSGFKTATTTTPAAASSSRTSPATTRAENRWRLGSSTERR